MTNDKDKEVKKPGDPKLETKTPEELSEGDFERVAGGSRGAGTTIHCSVDDCGISH